MKFPIDKRWRPMAFPLLAVGIIAVDDTVLDLALPSISRDLGASTEELQWAINAYVLAFAGPLVASGTLADRLGHKRMLLIGSALFGLASFAASLASSTAMLIGLRAAQGLAGAILLPATLALLRATFPAAHERTVAIGVWSALFSVGAMLGPLVGGALLEAYGWRSVFLINVPIALLTFAGTALFVRESRAPETAAIPYQGLLIAVAAVVTLVYAITAAGARGFSGLVIAAVAASVLLFAGLVVQQRRSPDPLLPPGLLRNRSFTGASSAMAITVFALMGSLFFLSQYLQSVLGFSPLAAGLLMLPLALLEAVGALTTARIISRLGVKMTLGGSLAASAVGLAVLALGIAPDPGVWALLIGGGLLSSALGVALTAATDSILGTLPVSRAGIGSALDETLQHFGAALGVAVLGAVANLIYRHGVHAAVSDGLLSPALAGKAEGSVQGALVAAETLPRGDADAVVAAAAHSFCNGMLMAMWVGAAILFAVAALALWLVPTHVVETKVSPPRREP